MKAIKMDLPNFSKYILEFCKFALVAKKAYKNGTTLKEEAIKSGLINNKDYDKVVDPKKMINPH